MGLNNPNTAEIGQLLVEKTQFEHLNLGALVPGEETVS